MLQKKLIRIIKYGYTAALPTFAAALLVISCSSGGRNAKTYLSEAEKAYENSNFQLAKLKIDSIKELFPKAFNEINAGFMLMQEIRFAENKRNIFFCDSMLQVNYALLNQMLPKFDYVRDTRYQEFGEYYPKAYPHGTSLHQNGLRSGVGEKGTFFIESILAGSSAKHNKIRVTTRDGSFAESLPVTTDGLNYRFNTIDGSFEIVRYTGNNENGVGEFIHAFGREPLSVHFIGNGTVTAVLTDAAKEAVTQSFELSNLLSDIQQLKFEKEKSETLLRYLESKKK